jgi:hypothetical protein
MPSVLKKSHPQKLRIEEHTSTKISFSPWNIDTSSYKKIPDVIDFDPTVFRIQHHSSRTRRREDVERVVPSKRAADFTLLKRSIHPSRQKYVTSEKSARHAAGAINYVVLWLQGRCHCRALKFNLSLCNAAAGIFHSQINARFVWNLRARFAFRMGGRARYLACRTQPNDFLSKAPRRPLYLWPEMEKHYLCCSADLFVAASIPSSVEQESVVNSAGVAMFCPTRRRLYWSGDVHVRPRAREQGMLKN